MKRRNKDYEIDVPVNTDERLSPGTALGMFLAGLAMLIAGLFIFSQKVLVHTTFFSNGFRIGTFHLNSGMIIIPLIIGIIWLFVRPKSIGGKIVTAIGVLIIIISVIMSTSIRLTTMTLFDWVLILVLIFGGVGLLLRVLLAK